jgi:hypothetical protein
MYYLKITLRFAFGAVIALFLITILSHIFNNGTEDVAAYAYARSVFFLELPASLILLIISMYSYLKKKVPWSFFRIEYSFLIASMSPFFIGWFLYVIWPYFNYLYSVYQQ